MSSGRTGRRQRKLRQQEVRVQIARVRRRLGRRLDRLADHGGVMRSWRGYVEHHPARSLAAAAGLGLLLATLGGRGGSLAQLGSRLCDLTAGGNWNAVWNELLRMFAEKAGSAAGQARGGSEHE